MPDRERRFLQMLGTSGTGRPPVPLSAWELWTQRLASGRRTGWCDLVLALEADPGSHPAQPDGGPEALEGSGASPGRWPPAE